MIIGEKDNHNIKPRRGEILIDKIPNATIKLQRSDIFKSVLQSINFLFFMLVFQNA